MRQATMTHQHTLDYEEDEDGNLTSIGACECGTPVPKPCSYGEQCSDYLNAIDKWGITFYGEALS